jgi:hypothetical protein
MRPGTRQIDPHLAALMDPERSSLDYGDPHMAALEPDADDYGGPSDMDSDDAGSYAIDNGTQSTPYQRDPSGHSGPAMDRYRNLNRETEEADVASGYGGVHDATETYATGLPTAYAAAQREAGLKGVQMPDLFGDDPHMAALAPYQSFNGHAGPAVDRMMSMPPEAQFAPMADPESGMEATPEMADAYAEAEREAALKGVNIRDHVPRSMLRSVR